MSNDDVIGLCSDCGSEQSDRAMYASPFAQAGVPPVCKYCGGVVVICYRQNKQKVLDDIKRQRGIQ
jgi:methylmalonyl-CoA mutase cobalamin-binding subunit